MQPNHTSDVQSDVRTSFPCDTHACSQTCSHLLKHPAVRTLGHSAPRLCCRLGLTPWQVVVLYYLASLSAKRVISYGEIAHRLQAWTGEETTAGSVRAVIARLENKGHLRHVRKRQGMLQGIIVQVVEVECPIFISAKGQFAPERGPCAQSLAHSPEQSAMLSVVQSPMRSASSRDEEIEDFNPSSFYQTHRGLTSLTEDVLKTHFPKLVEERLMPATIRQIADENEKSGRSCEHIWEGLSYAEWQLNNGGITDKQGDKVKSIIGYIYKALAKNGHYARPIGYESEMDRYLDQKSEEIARIRERHDRLFEEGFQLWRNGLSVEEEQNLIGPDIKPDMRLLSERRLKIVYREKHWRTYLSSSLPKNSLPEDSPG